MNFSAIIAEFNPFHNGHEYLIKQAKEATGLPLMCLMSGDFVQRGEPAIVDKYARAKCAISAGADMVVQLPTIYSLSSAQIFAKGAIRLLNELGCSHLVIGVTHCILEDYYALAKIKNTNLKSAIANQLDNGTNYSKALINVLKTKYPNSDKIFTDASNILALEYIEQILSQNANIKIVLVNRTDGGYNNTQAIKQYANASTIRAHIYNGENKSCLKYIPKYCHFQLDNISDTKGINNIVLYNLRNNSPESLTQYYDYSEGLPYLISSSSRETTSLEQTIERATNKRYRSARIKKLCLYPSLNITDPNLRTIKKGKLVAKLLAIKRSQKAFISQFNQKYVRVIVSNTDYNHLSKAQSICANIDLDASNLYSFACKKPYNNDIKIGTLFID